MRTPLLSTSGVPRTSVTKSSWRLVMSTIICLSNVLAIACLVHNYKLVPSWACGQPKWPQFPRSSKIDYPIWWFAPFFDRTSYGKEAAMSVLSLARSGLAGKGKLWIGTAQMDCKYSRDDSMLVEDFDQLDTMNRRGITSKPAIVVCHSLPSYWTRSQAKWDSCAPCPPKDYQPAYAIGRAMVETDMYHPDFVKSCNNMDEIWVPSAFSRDVLLTSGVQAHKVRVVPIATNVTWFHPESVEPMELPLGELAFGRHRKRSKATVTAQHRSTDSEPSGGRKNPESIPMQVASQVTVKTPSQPKKPLVFISCFKWEMRKGWDALLAAYLQEFSSEDNVELYILTKPFMTGNNFVDDMHMWAQRYLGTTLSDHPWLPTLYVIPEHVTDIQYRRLLKAADAYVIATRGEGWGMPIAEAMSMGLPIVATNWSGVADFVDESVGYMVDYSMAKVPKDEPWWLVGGNWAEPSIDSLRQRMREVVSNPDAAAEKGKRARERIASKYSPNALAHILQDEFERVSAIVKKGYKALDPAPRPQEQAQAARRHKGHMHRTPQRKDRSDHQRSG